MESTEWRRRFAEYLAAQAVHDQAQTCLRQMEARGATCSSGDEQAAVEAGIAVASRRVGSTGRRLARAVGAFTLGRSILEAVWAAPDDI